MKNKIKETYRQMMERHSKEIRDRQDNCHHTYVQAVFGKYCVYCNKIKKEEENIGPEKI